MHELSVVRVEGLFKTCFSRPSLFSVFLVPHSIRCYLSLSSASFYSLLLISFLPCFILFAATYLFLALLHSKHCYLSLSCASFHSLLLISFLPCFILFAATYLFLVLHSNRYYNELTHAKAALVILA